MTSAASRSAGCCRSQAAHGRARSSSSTAWGRTTWLRRSREPRRRPAASPHRVVDGHLPVRRRDDPPRQHRCRAGDPAGRTQLDDCGRRHLPLRALRRHARPRRTHGRHPGVGRRSGIERGGRAFLRPLSPPDRCRPLQDGGVQARLIAGSAYGLTSPAATRSPLFYLHAELKARCPPAAAGRVPRARRLRRPRQHQGRRQPLRRRSDGCLLRAGCGQHRGGRGCAPHAARRRAAGRPAHLVELRVLEKGTHRTGKGRLARRQDCRAADGQPGVHSAAGRRPSPQPEPMS